MKFSVLLGKSRKKSAVTTIRDLITRFDSDSKPIIKTEDPPSFNTLMARKKNIGSYKGILYKLM